MVGTNHSNKKEKGYDGRGVGNSCMLCGVSFEVILAKGSKSSKVEVRNGLNNIDSVIDFLYMFEFVYVSRLCYNTTVTVLEEMI